MDVETAFTTFFILVGLPAAIAAAVFVVSAIVYAAFVSVGYFLAAVADTLKTESDTNG